jgi:cysteine-rich repeat protein
MSIRRAAAALFHTLVLTALLAFATQAGRAGAAEQVFDVDETASTFSTGSIDVNFHAVIHGFGWPPQDSWGTATVTDAMYDADGTVILDPDTSTVTLQDLQIGGDVGAVGIGEVVWEDIITLELVYEIVSQSLSLNAPVTVPLVDNAFSALPNFEFAGVSDGEVTGLLINYDIGEQEFSGDGDMPVSGALSTAGSDLLLDLTAAQMQVDLGGSPTVTIDVYECALWLIGCVFYLTTADVTVTDLTYNDVQMTLAASSPLASVCGNSAVEPGEDCDDGNTDDGDCCSATCTYEASGSPCGNPGDGLCDLQDTCDGAGVCDDNVEPPTAVCRADEGECDVEELCDGAGSCPVDNFEAPGTPCGDPGDGICDLQDTCDGAGFCIGNVEPPTTVCRADEGECDVEELCDGAGSCPVDGFEAPGTPCGNPGDGLCDLQDTCDGAGACDDNVEPPTTVCRASAGDCDVEEYCDGAGSCLVESFEPPSVECRAAVDICDVAEYCTGSGPDCPADVLLDGTSCADSDVCNGDEMCVVGVCTAGTPLTCDDGDDCTADGCDAFTGCFNDPIPLCGAAVPATPSWGPALVGLLMLLGSGLLLRVRRRASG